MDSDSIDDEAEARLAGSKRRRVRAVSVVDRDDASASADEDGSDGADDDVDGESDDETDSDDGAGERDDGDDALFFALEKVPQYLVLSRIDCAAAGNLRKPKGINLVSKIRKTIEDIISLCNGRAPPVPAHATRWRAMSETFESAINSTDPSEVGKLHPFILKPERR